MAAKASRNTTLPRRRAVVAVTTMALLAGM
jgi:hypothetical protein